MKRRKSMEQRSIKKAWTFIKWYRVHNRLPHNKSEEQELYWWISYQRRFLVYSSVLKLLNEHVPDWKSAKNNLEQRSIENAWTFIHWYRIHKRYPHYNSESESFYYQWISHQRKTRHNPSLGYYESVHKLLDIHVPCWRKSRKEFKEPIDDFAHKLLKFEGFIQPNLANQVE